jgi:eukaryotic-like serine/threonine-protein kinase
MPSIDSEAFLKNLRRSGLMTRQEIEEVLPRLPRSSRGRVVARSLVEMGLLTKFQAELLLAGRTNGFLLGQYRILEQLGQGGMGRVFKAVHQTMNRTVALKLLAPHLVQTPKARDLFQREVRAAAKLNHPSIVTAYDANQIEDRHFLVMEFVDGPNLDQLVRGQKPLPIPLVCEIIRQAANGLQYAQEMGMVHRDIKPANLLVQLAGPNQDLTVKILDFGLARLHEPGQEALPGGDRVIMGTPDFLSPEQAALEEVDVRSDLYSLGCTFYFLLTGRVPFPKGTALEKLERHKTEDPVPVEELRPDVPAAVAGIVRRLMAKYPPHRFQTPAELAAALVPYASAEATTLPATRPATDLSATSDHALPETSDLNLDRPSDGALVGTLPPDFTPTPASHLSLPPPLKPAAPEARRWGFRFTTLAAAFTLIALIVLLVIFLNG